MNTGPSFDAITLFHVFENMPDPHDALGRIKDLLKPGGVFVMKEPCGGDNLEDNIGNPFAPILYATSTLHCLTVSLAHDGAGISGRLP